MVFRLSLPLEIERPDQQFSGFQAVPVQIIYEAGRWRAQCQEPPVLTTSCDTLQEALVCAAKEIQRDWLMVST